VDIPLSILLAPDVGDAATMRGHLQDSNLRGVRNLREELVQRIRQLQFPFLSDWRLRVETTAPRANISRLFFFRENYRPIAAF